MNNVFAYGTLLLDDVFEIVVGCKRESTPAIAYGFARVCLVDRVYPAIVPMDDCSVLGCLYQAVDAESLHAIHAFEDPIYDPELIPVSIGHSGSSVDATAYVLREEHATLALQQPWILEDFVDKNLRPYLSACRAWRREYEKGIEKRPR